VGSGCRLKSLRAYCWACGNEVERAATIRRLVKSGGMAAMRRALEGCPDAGREREEEIVPEPVGHRMARELLVRLARGER
jgi:hypothetical protein